ncbi:hypothetical protein ACFFUE_07065 [Bergeyella porcorum]|uniref:hypothetical protein n=1 Tax=Bergeyella porcorum TaxID=1735111 RepID=UPI0035E572F5
MFERVLFRGARVMRGSKPKIGELLLKSMKECEDVDTANEYLSVAQMLEIPIFLELQEMFDKKFPCILKNLRNGQF